MAAKKVVIACDEQGQYSVGEMPTAMDGAQPSEPQMQPAPSLDAALDMAAGMLESDPAAEAEGEQGLLAGFKKGMGEGYQEGM
jgi:hypothetical protein